MTSASVCLETRSAVRCRVPVSSERMVGIRHQLDVGHRDPRRVAVEDDGAVHLRHLVEQRRRVVDVELDPTREEEAELLRIADDDEATSAGVEDVVEALAQCRAGGDHLQGLHEPGLLAAFELGELIPGTLRHQGRF